MQVNPENGPPEIYVTWSNPRMTDFENVQLPEIHNVNPQPNTRGILQPMPITLVRRSWPLQINSDLLKVPIYVMTKLLKMIDVS